MPRLIEILATGTVAVMLAANAAHADSRLFSARSDKSGVSVTGASLNGKDLPVAGQGGGVTFFRVDNPGGSVPCAERIAFTGSNGLVATIDTDICANGAQVTVPFSTAGAAPPPPAPPAAPAASSAGRRPTGRRSAGGDQRRRSRRHHRQRLHGRQAGRHQPAHRQCGRGAGGAGTGRHHLRARSRPGALRRTAHRPRRRHLRQ